MLKIVLVVFVAVTFCDIKNEEKPTCDTVFCGKGQECIETKNDAVCECIEKCNDERSLVCGSNGTYLQTYENECSLYRQACIEKESNMKITLVANISCNAVIEKDKYITQDIEKDSSKPKPVVCMTKDRDALREAIIGWIQGRIDVEKEMSYKGMLLKYFNMLDIDQDHRLDTIEFMRLVEEGMSEIVSKKKYTSPILRDLCLSELMSAADDNADYKLEFDEFYKCLDPEYHPPKEVCELEGKVYSDGRDVAMDCNVCKCACGHWVCTRLECDKENQTADQAMTVNKI